VSAVDAGVVLAVTSQSEELIGFRLDITSRSRVDLALSETARAWIWFVSTIGTYWLG
jgi:hypothetical protein